jgi:hypothetical protein
MRPPKLFAALCITAVIAAGCANNKRIVRGTPPSVSTPPPTEVPAAPPPAMQPPAETPKAPPTEITLPTPEPEPPKRVAPKPRPAPAEAEPAQPKPAAPQISPQLSARDLAAARTRTTNNITTAEKNLQSANGRGQSAAQKDLSEKIRSFLSQAHEAIVAEDWVRAQNLADKARVLSTELVNSF